MQPKQDNSAENYPVRPVSVITVARWH